MDWHGNQTQFNFRSQPYNGLTVFNLPDQVEHVFNVTDPLNVKKIVIGYPIGMNYKKNEMTKIIDLFKEDMEKAGFKVFLEDERLSSEYAKKVMIEQNIKTGRNKELVDLTAASIILQTYLDRSKHS